MSDVAAKKDSLARNRDYTLLWSGQALAEAGFGATLFVLPLLALALTGSPGVSGLVLSVDAAAQLLVGLPAGALVDRWNRKRIMLACEAAQVVALASLVFVLWTDTASVVHLVAVAAVLGAARALFEPAEDASLPRIVPEHQLATAVAMNTARSSLGQMGGSALGGLLYSLGRALPFLFDLVTHCVAFVALAFLRLPPREKPETAEKTHLVREIGEGLRWVWSRPEIRVTTLCAVVLNLFFSAYYLVVIVLATGRGVPSTETGVMASMLGVGGVVGALIAPRLHRVLGPYRSIAIVFWVATALTPVALLIDDGYLMGVLFAGMTLLVPTANTTIGTHQLLLTPDELRGRLSGVLAVAVGTAGAVGPVLGGLLTELLDPVPAVVVCTVGIALVTAYVTVSPTLRHYPEKGQQ
ncbi:MFS transporter [Saccharothrix violaceirubra]|uniref:MFS family permease n=1 Tax=Saccharothrix violaceirubra TaxID=413306 RepID=A0A7W7T1U5_9PSEU|nr:MFS transporter [Saccharothrix violaceirubra]MBB4965017.1 MFS family permease [Saccharothrix violaceirubra]